MYSNSQDPGLLAEDVAEQKLLSGMDKLSQIERRLKGYLESPATTKPDSR